MTRRVPVLPTIVVLAAVATMIALGFWQLGRMRWKEDLLARYAQALAMSSDAAWPTNEVEVEGVLYRHATITCERVQSLSAMAGRNDRDETGWAHIARCAIAGGGDADIVLGWSRDPAEVAWGGGIAQGFIAPGRDGEARLIAGPPLAGLQANALPDPRAIPNNHLSYALQWFFFAATALTIYGLALRKRWRGALAGKASAD